MFSLIVIDVRDSETRECAALAMRESLDTGIVEAAPSPPGFVAIIVEDGVAIARTFGSAYRLCERRASEQRTLTESEMALPHCELDSGYGYYAGGRVNLPDGRQLSIGHELRLVERAV